MAHLLHTLAVLCAILPVSVPAGVVTPATVTDEFSNYADANSQLIFADLPSTDPYETDPETYDSMGLTPFFNGMHGFVDICFGDIPYGMFAACVVLPYSSYIYDIYVYDVILR